MKKGARYVGKKGLIFQANELDTASLPRVDSHLHTSWTDGKATVEAVYHAAIESGLDTILYSEHSRKTSIDWFPSFAAEVRALPSSPCAAYVGTEVKVESRQGEIDTVPAISDLCDFVMASVHRFIDVDGRTLQFSEVDPNEAVDLEFKLTWAVLANPQVDILGHMFGMCYRRFNVTPPDDKIIALISRAAEFGVAVEINSHYHANPRKMIQWCRHHHALITFGSNAHTLENVGAIMRLLDQEVENV
jgi:histidinol phosphatase-like PHP family hydrolase